MENIFSMKVSEAFNKCQTTELANELWNFKNPGESIENRDDDREYISWINSLPCFLTCAMNAGLEDLNVIFEMKTPISGKSVDVTLIGFDKEKINHQILLVELKQWGEIPDTQYNSDKVYVCRSIGSRKHPIKQVKNYWENLENHHSGIFKARSNNIHISVKKAVYLHNCNHPEKLITIPRYKKWVNEDCNIYGENDEQKLINDLKELFSTENDEKILEIIKDYDAVLGDAGLAGLKKAYKNEASYEMMQDQQDIVDFVVQKLKIQKEEPKKEIVVISGGPGTGKTIVGIRFVLEYMNIFNGGKNDNKAIFTLPKSKTVKAMFDAACCVDDDNENEYCCYLDEISKYQNLVIVDEAHRISDLKNTLDTVFLKKEAKLVIFLQDDHQIVRPNEQGTLQNLIKYAQFNNIQISTPKEYPILNLRDEKRCDENLLMGVSKLFFDNSIKINSQIENVKIFDSFEALDKWKSELALNSRTKYIMPFCDKWKSRGESDFNNATPDIEIDGIKKYWNPDDPDDQVIWLNDKNDDRVACIYTCQGLDFDNVAFVWCEDLRWDENNSKWICDINKLNDPSFRYKFNTQTNLFERSIYNKKTGVSSINTISQEYIDFLIKNTYYVMLTRPRHSIGIYFKDEATKKHVIETLELSNADAKIEQTNDDNVIIGNSSCKIYHKNGCDFIPRKIEKVVKFKSIQEAEKEGYRPCYNCMGSRK